MRLIFEPSRLKLYISPCASKMKAMTGLVRNAAVGRWAGAVEGKTSGQDAVDGAWERRAGA